MLLSLETLNQLTDGATWVCIDLETDGLHFKKNHIVGIAILTDKGGGYLPLSPYRTLDNPIPVDGISLEEIKPILTSILTSIPIINWNIKFDLHFLMEEGFIDNIDSLHIIDPMVGYWLLNEEGKLGLKDVLQFVATGDFPDFHEILKRTTELLHKETEAAREAYAMQAPKRQKGKYRLEANDIFLMRGATVYDVPIEWISVYAFRDVVATAYLWFHFIRPQLEKEELLNYFFSYEIPFLQVLFSMEHHGIHIDIKKLKELEQQGREELEDLILQINEFAGYIINPNSTRALSQMLFKEHSFEPPSKITRTGEISLDRNSLKELHWKYGQETNIFKLLLQYRKLTKVIETYYVGLQSEQVEGIIYPNFNQTGTETGRLSCNSPNTQNIPKKGKLKQIFIPSSGNAFIKFDLSQAELRILADRTKDSLLVKNYQEGKDIHAETMKTTGVTDRRLAKILNFSVAYGGGANRYQQTLFFDNEIYRSLEDCRKDIKNFYNSYKGVNIWKRAVLELARTQGYVISIFGRRRHVEGINNPEYIIRGYAERQAINAQIQGDVADLMKGAMITIYNLLQKKKDGHILIQVHDELLIEVPKNIAESQAVVIKQLVENLLSLSVPIVADVEIGDTWGTTKLLEETVKN